jgi:hypothetical protein
VNQFTHPAAAKRIGGRTYQPADIRDHVAPLHALEEDTRDVCEVYGNTSVPVAVEDEREEHTARYGEEE